MGRRVSRFLAAKVRIVVESTKYLGYSAMICDEWQYNLKCGVNVKLLLFS